MKNRAVIYARFSSHGQTDQSIEGQLRECYSFAEDLINYAKAGGDMESLNAGNVYGLLNREIKN